MHKEEEEYSQYLHSEVEAKDSLVRMLQRPSDPHIAHIVFEAYLCTAHKIAQLLPIIIVIDLEGESSHTVNEVKAEYLLPNRVEILILDAGFANLDSIQRDDDVWIGGSKISNNEIRSSKIGED